MSCLEIVQHDLNIISILGEHGSYEEPAWILGGGGTSRNTWLCNFPRPGALQNCPKCFFNYELCLKKICVLQNWLFWIHYDLEAAIGFMSVEVFLIPRAKPKTTRTAKLWQDTWEVLAHKAGYCLACCDAQCNVTVIPLTKQIQLL